MRASEEVRGRVLDILKSQSSDERGARWEDIVRECTMQGIKETDCEDALDDLMGSGTIEEHSLAMFRVKVAP